MTNPIVLVLSLFVLLFSCQYEPSNFQSNNNSRIADLKTPNEIPEKNKLVVETVKKYGPSISSTYEKAVCTELVIQILQKVQPLSKTDRNRIRIITDEDVHDLLDQNSDIPKGVYYALTKKGIGKPIDNLNDVCEGDFVQFWTRTWGHCGIVKSIDVDNERMELYSSFPTTNGYGIQEFSIPKHVFFVRLK